MIEKIKSLDIVEVIGSFIPLRKEGADIYKACCPFHQEKTASFVVSAKKQIYHCFGCNKHGDLINFVQEYKGINDFSELKSFFEDNFNLDLSKNVPKKQKNNSLSEFLNICKAELKEKEQILKYLKNRGLNDEDIAEFEIGLGPKNYCLLKAISNKDGAEELGVISRGKTGYYSLFSNRIIFPIRNAQGRLCGFSGRSHPYYNFLNQGKYLNSKDSYIFKKSQLLYNLDKAKDEIRKNGEVILVEGFMDVIGMVKFGYKNAIASLGTAFNKMHLIQILKTYQNPTINLALDRDDAGINAMERCIEVCFSAGVYDVFVWILKDSKDVGECMEKNITPKFNKFSAIKFLCYKLTKNADIKQKQLALNKIKEIILNIRDFLYKDAFSLEASEFFGVDINFFKSAPIIRYVSANINIERIAKASLLDDNIKYLLQNYLDDIELSYLKDSLHLYIKEAKIDESLNKILFNDEIKLPNRQQSIEILKSLRLQTLKKELKSASIKKDFAKVQEINLKILDLKQNHST